VIDIQLEDIVTPTQAAGFLPQFRGGKKVNLSTIWRWMEEGISGVKLEALWVGGVRSTSKEALQRFCEGVTVTAARSKGPVGAGARQAAARTRTEAQRRKASSKAGEQLDRLIGNPPKRGRRAATSK
jgi:hypothetical protein